MIIENVGIEKVLANNYVYTALVTSIYYNFANVVNGIFLLTSLPINTQGRLGNTPLMWAAYFDRPSIVEWLLINQADVDIRNNQGENALDLAKKQGNREVMTLLINAHGISQ